RGDQEQEEHLTNRARNRPAEDQQQRQPDELNPARNLNRRRPLGHAGHATAQVVQLRGWTWTDLAGGTSRFPRDPLHWSADADRRLRRRFDVTEGVLALGCYELSAETAVSSRSALSRTRRRRPEL